MQIFRPLLPLALGVAVLFGAGCFGKADQTAPPQAKPAPKAGAKPAEPAKDPQTELQEVLGAFHASKSYRTKFRLPTKDGVVRGTLDHVKPSRYQGTTQLGDSDVSEVVIVDDSLYMKIGQYPWADMSDTAAAQSIVSNIKQAAEGEAAFKLQNEAKLQVKQRYNDELNSCVLFIASSSDSDPKAPPIKICVKGGMPKYLEMDTDLGIYHVDFYDFNSVFIIERPM
jgi:hypothetical protein